MHSYMIWENKKGEPLILQDTSDDDGGKSITNSVDEIVPELFKEGLLVEGRRLFYYDTDENLDEIKIKDGQFLKFWPGPKSGDLNDIE